MDNEEVGKRIKGLRLKRKMTREALAEAADISVSFLYEIETGKKSFSAYTLGNLSKALHIESDYILHGDAEQNYVQLRNDIISRESLLCIQQMLLEVYNGIQQLIDN